RALAHGLADRALHGAAVADALLKLGGDIFSNQRRVGVRLFNLRNLDLDLLARHFFQPLAHLLHRFALTPDEDAGAGGVDGHQKLVRIALDLQTRDAGALRFRADVTTNLEVFVQLLGITLLFRKPARIPITVHLQAKADRVYFTAHTFLFPFSLCQDDRQVRGATLARLIAATRTGLPALLHRPAIRVNRTNVHASRVQVKVVLCIRQRRSHGLGHELRALLRHELQDHQRFLGIQPAHFIAHETELLWGDRQVTNSGTDFHRSPLFLLLLDHVAAIRPRGGKLAQLMANHVFRHINRYMAAAIMHGNRVAHNLRKDRARAPPG